MGRALGEGGFGTDSAGTVQHVWELYPVKYDGKL